MAAVLVPMVLSILLTTFPGAAGCHGLVPPQPSAVVEPFAPSGRWSGHWGVDVASAPGSPVRSIGAGRVSFVGTVVRNTVVTVDHGGGIRTSYSYLAETLANRGSGIRRGVPIGTSGVHDGADAFHLSLRIGSSYVDPMALHACAASPASALYLSSGSRTYPRRRDRHLRRNLRSSPHGTPRCCDSGG